MTNMQATASEDMVLFTGAAERFTRSVVAPAAAALDGSGSAELDRVLEHAAELGLLCLGTPAAAGGVAQEVDALCAVLLPIAREHAGIAALLFVHAGAEQLLAATGAWPAAVSAGDLLSWPAFSAVGAPAEARFDLERARLDGALPLVPLSTRARQLVVPVRAGADRVELALCAAEASGLSRAPVDVLGLECCAPADLVLDAVPAVRAGALDPAALAEVTATLSLGVAAIALGLVEGTFATALDYAHERRQGARRIVDWLEVRRLLSGARESALVLGAALDGVLAARRAGDARWRDTATALALSATEAACEATTDGVQLLGGNGYTKDYPQERRMRDARQLRCLLGAAPARRRAAFDAWLAAAR